MRILSEITGKEYKTVEECTKAEEQYKAEQQEEANKESLRLAELSKEKKVLAKAIEDAEANVTEANKLYEVARQKAADILEESNQKVENILKEAREKVKEAETNKLNALMKFNKEFGTYKTVITGEKAAEEYSKAINRCNSIDDIFKDIMKYWF